MKKILRLLPFVLILSGPVLGQNTPTITQTATNTPTPTPTLGAPSTPGNTDFAAFKYGGFKADPTGNGTTFDVFTITILGLKMGDWIVVYPPASYTATILSWRILTNNTLQVIAIGTDTAEGDFEYVWFSRTQESCGHAPFCRRAPTVTPTPS